MATEDAFRSAQHLAYAYILNRIRKGELVGGDRLIPEEIAAEISVSRMPVREAIRQLDSEGLITIRPNRGAVVTELAPEDVREIFEMRARLEGLAARNAATCMTDDLEDGLVLQLRRLARAANAVDNFVIQHEEFHRLICAAGGRYWLAGETRRLRAATEPYLRLYFTRHEGADQTRQEHERLLQALIARDPAEADAVMQQHILSTAPALIGFLRGEAPPD